jgi:hypothetical protein
MISPIGKQSKKKGRFDEQLKLITALRDGMFVVVPLLYVVGYLVWSFNAWQNHLGLLPALDPQYFVAGLAPVIIVLIAYLGGTYLKRFLVDKWPVLVGKEAKGIWLVIRTLFLYMFWATLALIGGPALAAFLLVVYLSYKFLKRFAPKTWSKLTDKENMGGRVKIARAALVLLILVAFVFLVLKRDYFSRIILANYAESLESFLLFSFFVSVTLLPPMDEAVFNWISKAYRFLWLYFGVLLFIVLGLTFYLETVYPKIPQEFGGVRPRCAYLDVVKSQVSNETLQGIAPPDALNSSQAVVRSLKVDVLYSGSSLILVRSQKRVYEIAKGVIQTTSPCD